MSSLRKRGSLFFFLQASLSFYTPSTSRCWSASSVPSKTAPKSFGEKFWKKIRLQWRTNFVTNCAIWSICPPPQPSKYVSSTWTSPGSPSMLSTSSRPSLMRDVRSVRGEREKRNGGTRRSPSRWISNLGSIQTRKWGSSPISTFPNSGRANLSLGHPSRWRRLTARWAPPLTPVDITTTRACPLLRCSVRVWLSLLNLLSTEVEHTLPSELPGLATPLDMTAIKVRMHLTLSTKIIHKLDN